jgi:PAS domain S-box-containing protein/putative nucleotidyltransferase with HDIG domain
VVLNLAYHGLAMDEEVDPHSSRSLEGDIPLSELAVPIFGAVSDAIIICRADTLRILAANPAAISLYGYSLAELRTMDLPDISAEPNESRNHIAQTIRSNKTTREVRRHRRKDGGLLTVEASGTVFRWRERPLLVGVFRDFSVHQAADDAIQRHIEQIERALTGTVESIAAMGEVRDPYTAQHARRVSALSERIAVDLGMSADAARGLHIIGVLHDVGKIAVPAEILTRPGRLNAVEFALIKEHARRGHEILRKIEFPWSVAEAVLQHHERLDGSGYPSGLTGNAICIEARIIAVADVVEAMASHRPYRPSLGIDRALAEIELHRGRLYDNDAANSCVRLFREKGYRLEP